ncbi:hypothetical protein [Massilia soli]|uniref:DUF2116 family Zn-ribbon domain-containing protein n=1 Tax=Massilia soli TaxID=2792854 RepID=A0ABS7SJV9_9BURK|nr:hypothetical protein [Massilia soli]MBZ2206483.1 hypothetical protein [Massilia soli]
MGTTQENLPENDGNVELPAAPVMGAVLARQALPPKGSCWYCEKPLDSVRRFCGKDCADSFDEEAEYTR